MSESEQQERDEEKIEDLDVPEEASEDVRGGVAPPSGPVPIPYPNQRR